MPVAPGCCGWVKHRREFIVMVVDGASSHVGKDRTKQSFEKFFTLIGQRTASKVEFICSDVCLGIRHPYLEVIAKHCPQALNILDRFHMVAKLNTALDVGEARRMLRDGYEPVLKKKRWCLLKRPENLSDKKRMSLRELLGYNRQSVRAYLLKEEFQLFWEYTSPAWAAKFLDAWCKRAMRSRIDPVKSVPPVSELELL